MPEWTGPGFHDSAPNIYGGLQTRKGQLSVVPLRSRAVIIAAAISLLLLAARATGTPALSDPTGRALPSGLALHSPPLVLFLAPLFDLWDGTSMLSMERLTGWLAGVLLLLLLWRIAAWALRRRRPTDTAWWWRGGQEAVVIILFLLALLAFLAGGALWHRPMVALAGTGQDIMVVDLHSHTNASHDVEHTLMGGFDAAALRRWHRRAGFDAAFITDHNTVAGLPPAGAGTILPALCPGTEVSGWRAHIVLLGTRQRVERSPYADSLAGLLTLFKDAQDQGAVSIASLPEYSRNHWENLGRFAAAGVDGFEIVNASPKANDFPRSRRDSVIALARAQDLLVVGVSDSHGWGATSMVWNLVDLPGWRSTGSPCDRLLERLREGGFEAVQVVERHRLRPDDWWPSLLTPVGVVWETWRSMDWRHVLAWLVWIWIIAGLRARWVSLRRRA